MNRRKFIRAFAGAVATVAIGMRVSHGMPALPMITESKIILASPDVESSLKFKASMRFSQFNHTDWRAVYGSPG